MFQLRRLMPLVLTLMPVSGGKNLVPGGRQLEALFE
jgi:hypothetical protein